jgi:hypothetical protein
VGGILEGAVLVAAQGRAAPAQQVRQLALAQDQGLAEVPDFLRLQQAMGLAILAIGHVQRVVGRGRVVELRPAELALQIVHGHAVLLATHRDIFRAINSGQIARGLTIWAEAFHLRSFLTSLGHPGSEAGT